MSIQQSIHNGIVYRLCAKLQLTKIYDSLLKVYQFILRKLILLFNIKKKSNLKVFFEYYNHFTHPYFKKRYYGERAPLSWTDLKSSKIVHCIQQCSPKYKEKKIIIEPNDHVLVIGASLGIYKPSELVMRSNEISNFIASSAISRVLIGNNEIFNHAKIYFSNSALKKFFIYPEFSCVPKVNEFYIEEKKKNFSNRKIRFLSIASDFKKKAVDLLIDAFIESKVSSELTLVCHNVPDHFKKKVFKNKNIYLIEDIPLTEKKKDRLYRNSDVYINTTHIDGGTVAVNALEYGLPIITHTYHRGKSYVENGNGFLLNEPMKYYEPKNYGINWNSINDYLEQVKILKNSGGYAHVQNQFINCLKHYEKQPRDIFDHGILSLKLAKNNNLEKSNQILIDLYNQVSSE